MDNQETINKPPLSMIDGVALIVGIVVGAGIFETPSLVAGNTGNSTTALALWLAGGIISIIGAVCVAELATTYPHPGGNYHYLQRAFGQGFAFLEAWARITVVQTGSLALLAFVFGDYASQIWRLGEYSPSIYAVLLIMILTGINLLGIRQAKWIQNFIAAAILLGFALLIVSALVFVTPNSSPTTPPITTSGGNWGLAMVFVLLTYGGWNEAAYISAELRSVRKSMVPTLLVSIGIITVLYLLVNFAFIRGLGFTEVTNSEAVAADLMRKVSGDSGAIFISLLIAVATVGSANTTIITGARSSYALGRDFSWFGFLGRWNPKANNPTNALLVQAGIALVLVVIGTMARNGFKTMVEYTAPVFWSFFLLTAISLFVLRFKEKAIFRPFRVPLYPITPLLFCAICIYMLWSSLVYTGVGALVGVAVLTAGVVVFLLERFLRNKTEGRRQKVQEK